MIAPGAHVYTLVMIDGVLMPETPELKNRSAEQQARDLLERIGVEDAQSFSAGDLVELANLIADREQRHAPLTPEPTDYRALLVHYLAHVCAEEGVAFTEYVNASDSTILTHLRTAFSRDETAELRRLAEEAKDVP